MVVERERTLRRKGHLTPEESTTMSLDVEI